MYEDLKEKPIVTVKVTTNLNSDLKIQTYKVNIEVDKIHLYYVASLERCFGEYLSMMHDEKYYPQVLLPRLDHIKDIRNQLRQQVKLENIFSNYDWGYEDKD